MAITNCLTIDARVYRVSGLGRYLQNILPGLLPLLNVGRIRVLGHLAELLHEPWVNDPRIELVNYEARIFSLNEQLSAFRGLYRPCDLLWVPQYNVPLAYRGKLLVTIHDLCQLAHPEWLANDIQRWYAKKLYNSAARNADAILCASEFTAAEVSRCLRVDASNIVVTYPISVGSLSRPARREDDADHARTGYFLAVGNVKRNKNLKALIEAFGRVADHIPHDLIIVGRQEGFLNSDTELKGASTLLKGRIKFTGHVTDVELQGYYEQATALIFPSLYEGFGLPVIEAMAMHCPVACSDTSSLPEVAGDAAVLFNPLSIEDISNAIMQLATDESLRQKLIQCGDSRVASFRDCRSAEKTAEVINRLLRDSSLETRHEA